MNRSYGSKKTGWKRGIAFFLMFTLVVSVMLPGVTAGAAKKVASKSVSLSVSGGVKVLVAGNTYKISSTLSPKSSTDKVTFKSSNSKIATVTIAGTVTPRKSGNVTITATTASGKKASLKFLCVSKSGVVSIPTNVDKLLAAKNVKSIAIRELNDARTYTIKEGNYSSKSLFVNAPLSDVNNYGTFKNVSVVDVKDGTWREFGKNNNFVISDKKLTFVVEKEASVKGISVTGENASINFEVNGNTGKITLDHKANIVLKGSADKVVLEVSKEAAGSTVDSSVKIEASVNAGVTIKLSAGAEGSTITKKDETVSVGIDNQTKEDISVGTDGSDKTETIPPDTGNSNNGGGVTPPMVKNETVTGVASADKKSASYTLSYPIFNVTKAVVNVKGSVNKQYAINGDVLKYVVKLISGEATYINLWENTDEFSTTQGGLTVSFKGHGLEKTVTFDGVDYIVRVNKEDMSITVRKNDLLSDTYTLSKSSDNKTLYIKALNSTNVADIVTFDVTY